MYNSIIAGADIGGSHITVALIDLEKGKVLDHTWTRSGIDAQSDAESIIAAWSKAFEASFKAGGIAPTHLGIAMPGPFDYAQGISLMKNQNKYDALYNMNVKHMLSDRLGIDSTNIIMTNDAACFLQGELFGGVASGYERVVGLTLGTGLGSAMAVNGKAIDANLWCSLFKDGIAEDYLSNRWFVNRYLQLSGKKVEHVKALAELVQSDGCAGQVFNEFGKNLGTFLSPHVLEHRIDLVVLGGNIALALPLFSDALKDVLQANDTHVEIAQTFLGENATLVGAASYCWSEERV